MAEMYRHPLRMTPYNNLVQTGKYVVRPEDLPRARQLSCLQGAIKRAALKNILENMSFLIRRECKGGFSKRANLTGKISSAPRKQTFLYVI